MPTNNPPPSSQGSTVSFDGVPIGRLTNWRFTPATARCEEIVHVGCRVVGIGDNARVVGQRICLGIDPGGADIAMRNVPPWIGDDVGKLGTLTITCAAGSASWQAYLETFDAAGSVGEWLRGTARFQFSGGQL